MKKTHVMLVNWLNHKLRQSIYYHVPLNLIEIIHSSMPHHLKMKSGHGLQPTPNSQITSIFIRDMLRVILKTILSAKKNI